MMSTESTQAHILPPGVFSNFQQDLLLVIQNILRQHLADYDDQIKALFDHLTQLEEGQGQPMANVKELLESCHADIVKNVEERLTAFTSGNLDSVIKVLESLQADVQGMESQFGQSQKARAELASRVEEIRRGLDRLEKISDKLVSDMNNLELRQEELNDKLLTSPKKGFFSWFRSST
jgi:chromosome segregation ATPase